jgi:hypothetical protein
MVGSITVLPTASSAAQLERCEEAWFAPVLAALRTGRIAALNLRIGRNLHRVRYKTLRRWVRRARPWWQRFGT